MNDNLNNHCRCEPSNEGNVGRAIQCLSKRVSEFAKELSRIERELEELITQELTIVNDRINQEEIRASEKENQLEETTTQAGQNIQGNSESLNALGQKIDTEIQNRTEAIAHEINRATGVEQNLANLLGQESSRALGVESELSNAISTEQNRAINVERSIQNTLDNLNTQVSGDLPNIFELISTEETRAKAIEKACSDRLDVIEDVIPNAASVHNELADKNFVYSLVSTYSAIYQGNLNLVDDLDLPLSANYLAIENALATYFGDTVDKNDFCFVNIPTDDQNTGEIAVTEKFKFNGTVWKFEYALNTSGFTSDQFEALNSGITAALVAILENYPAYSELSDMIASKANNTITINNQPLTSNVTITKSTLGLGNVENYKAVSVEANQGLDSTEQSNARANIGAGTSSLTIGTTAGTAYDGADGDNLATRVAALESAIGNMKLQKVTSQEYNNLQTKDANTLYIIND